MEVRLPTAATGHWLEEAQRRWNVRVRLRACQPLGPLGRRLVQQLEYVAAPKEAAALLDFLRHRSDVRELSVAPGTAGHGILRVVGDMPPACGHVFEVGATCTNCALLLPRSPGAAVDWTVVVPAGDRLRRFIEGVTGPGSMGRGQIGIHPYAPPKDLSPRQLAALSTAQRLGYYGFPRGARLGDVARALGISRSSTAELLRGGEAKLVSAGLQLLRAEGGAAGTGSAEAAQ